MNIKTEEKQRPVDGFTAFSTGDEVRSLRTSLEITQTEFGAMLGVTKQSVWLWETGRMRPSMSCRMAMLQLRELYGKQPE